MAEGHATPHCAPEICAFFWGAWLLALAPGLFAQGAAPATPQEPEAYRIGAGDRLQLFVWKEPELTRELLVRIDGAVSVPLIGDVRAAGATTAELADSIQQKLSRFVNTPSVTVGLLVAGSAQFYVVGRVAKPGAYPLERPTTFLQGLAVAGGFTEYAKTERVIVFRTDGQLVYVNYKRLESGSDITDNVRLRAGDTILVP